MPIYEYRCSECGEEFEKFVRSMTAEVEVVCPACGSSEVEKKISLFGARGSSESALGLPAAGSCSTGST
ncbi:MAG: FmdB family zinc ribbon protein [Anaerolineae bacterium]